MLRIDRKQKQFAQLDVQALADASISEVHDLQEYISNSPDAFCKEIGQKLFIIGKEVQPSDTVQDRIDLLALDEEGNAVIIELKRGNHKLHLLQAISYAGMVAKWQTDDFLQLLDAEATERLQNFLIEDNDEINRQQKIILVAEAFDYAVLVSAEWLSEKFGVDIVCCRLSLSQDKQTNAEYLVCTNIFPAPEIARQAVGRGRIKHLPGKVKWSNWDAALSDITNTAVVSYYKQELAAKRDDYLLKRILRYSINGKRTWFLAARRKNAYAWQYTRFDGDVDFWKKGLSHPEEVGPVKEGKCLRFFLYSEKDFEFFHKAVTEQLQSVEWSNGAAVEEEDE
jgi:hypothetical protein